MVAATFANRLVQPAIVHVVHPPAVVETAALAGVATLDELGEKVGHVVSVRGAREPRVLAGQAEAAKQQHAHEKARLALSEPEPGDGRHAIVEAHLNSSSAKPPVCPPPPRLPPPPPPTRKLRPP